MSSLSRGWGIPCPVWGRPLDITSGYPHRRESGMYPLRQDTGYPTDRPGGPPMTGVHLPLGGTPLPQDPSSRITPLVVRQKCPSFKVSLHVPRYLSTESKGYLLELDPLILILKLDLDMVKMFCVLKLKFQTIMVTRLKYCKYVELLKR